MRTTRGLAGLLLLALVGCGGGTEEPKPAPRADGPPKDPGKKVAPPPPKVEPPPQTLVDAWTAAGATVGRLRKDRWADWDFAGKVPQLPDDVLAFSFDKLDPATLKKLAVPEVPFALLIDKANDNHLDGLARFDTLHVLHLLQCDGVSDAGLAKAAKVGSLRELTLLQGRPPDDPEQKPVAVTADGLKALAGMKNLERLQLDGYRDLDDGVFAALAGAKRLRSLAVQDANVGSGGLAGLAAFRDLRELDLSGTATADLAPVEGLTKLQVLRVRQCKGVGDAAIPSVLKLKDLQKLDLAYTAVTDAGVKQLGALKQLRLLGIIVGDAVTEASLRPLHAENPNLFLAK